MDVKTLEMFQGGLVEVDARDPGQGARERRAQRGSFLRQQRWERQRSKVGSARKVIMT